MERKKGTRTFTDLKKQFTQKELENFCKDIAIRYANSEDEFARSYFSEKFDITISCYYRVLEYAVVNNLVTDSEFNKMQEKAVRNQNSHATGAGRSTYEKYDNLYTERCKNIAASYDENDVKIFTLEFIERVNVTKKQLAEKFGISPRLADQILLRSILDSIISDEELDQMEKRCIVNRPDNQESIHRFFIKAKEERKN